MLGLVMPNVSWMNSGVKARPGAPAELDPGVLVKVERVDEDAVVIEDGEIGGGVGGQGRLLGMIDRRQEIGIREYEIGVWNLLAGL